MVDTVKSLSVMLRKVLDKRLRANAETFVQMFAEDGVMEFPFASPSSLRLEGRDAIAAHLEKNAARIEFQDVADVVKHETADPETIILEFAGFGRRVPSGEPFEQRYISVIRIREGQIVRYVDYWNPLAILRTLLGRDFVDSLSV